MLSYREIDKLLAAVQAARYTVSCAGEAADLDEAERILRRERRALIAHDYGWEADAPALRDAEQGGYERTQGY